MRRTVKTDVVREKMMTKEEQELEPLLRQAAERFLAIGHQDIWNSDDYTDELGVLCKRVADGLMKSGVSDDDKRKIYFVFAPTCEWDDSIGDVDLGNRIFGLLDELYRETTLMK
jgi:hypothetical protein